MTALRSALYVGEVVHARLRPVVHKFRYRVFALALDVDEIDAVAAKIPILSRNRFNAVGFFDGDVGEPTDRPVGEKIRTALSDAGLAACGARVTLLTYPRLWGFVFTPLTVYFCYDDREQLGAIVYEVTNTFHERRGYILKSDTRQACRKDIYVSPFIETPADYSFHTSPPGERVVVGVTLREGGEPLLRTHFAAARRPLTTPALAAALATHPLMTLKVVAAIHFEAARLWRKGVPVVSRHTSPAYSHSLVDPIPGAPS